MEKILRQQLDILKRIEDIAKQDRVIQAAQLYEGSRIKANDDVLVDRLNDLNKTMGNISDSVIKTTGQGLNSNFLRLTENVKKSSIDLSRILDRESRKTKAPEGIISSSVKSTLLKMKDFFSFRGFLDQTGIAKREGSGWLSRKMDSIEEQNKVAQARIDSGQLARDESGKWLSRDKSFEEFKKEERKAQALRTRAENLKSKIETKYGDRLDPEQIENTQLGKELRKVAEELSKLRIDWREDQEDNEDYQEEQSVTLKNIEKNTKQEAPNVPTAPPNNIRLTKAPNATSISEASGSGWDKFLGGVTRGITTLMNSIKSIGRGIGEGIGGIFSGILNGIADGLKALANPRVFIGVGALLGMSSAVWIVSDAFQKFARIEWDDVSKGFTVLAGLGLVAAVMGAAAPILLVGAGVIAALGVALVPVAFAMDLASGAMDKFAMAISKLAGIDSEGLSKIGPALLSIAGGLIAFSGASAIAGLTNLVNGLFSVISGQDTPVDQLEKMAGYGDGLQKAGSGLKSISSGMEGFNKIEPETMDLINKFPWLKATMFAAAGGRMQVIGPNGDGVKIGAEEKTIDLPSTPKPQSADLLYGKSAEVKQSETIMKSNNSTNVVNAPTTISKTTQNSISRSTSRNTESAVTKFIAGRYTPVTI